MQKQKEMEERNIYDMWHENENLKEKLKDLEDRSCSVNIYMGELEAVDRESWEQTEHILYCKRCLKLNYIIKDVQMESTHWVGKVNGKLRTTLGKLLNHRTKQEIVNETKNLKGTRVFINREYSRETTPKTKELQEQVKKLKKAK